MQKHRSGKCTICAQHFNLLHWHHTVPQALGGKDSLQIPLCSNCHNLLHAHAEAIVARVRKGTPIRRNYWPTDDDQERALPYLSILVDSMLNPIAESNKEYRVGALVPADIHSGLKRLAQDQGMNLSDTVLYCIVETLKSRGLFDGFRGQKNRSQSSRHTAQSKTDLW